MAYMSFKSSEFSFLTEKVIDYEETQYDRFEKVKYVFKGNVIDKCFKSKSLAEEGFLVREGLKHIDNESFY